ncbi:AMIN domain-containing protein [Nostoc sp.]|uniref:AMIN domain-containing protein n=1 Tax=Nostoc sp. TaxID=1180 RepID=UPI002FF75336
MRRLERILAGCRYFSLQLWAIALVLPMIQPAWGNEFPGIKQTQRNFSTSAVDLLAQQQGNVAVIEVTGVKVNSTSTGIEVILQTSQAEALQVVNKSDANSFIVEIPNAQLRLPLGDSFQQEKPFAGIAELTVTNIDANRIRITVKGEGGIPKVELFNSDEGLIFGLTPTTTTSQQPQTQPETPTNQTQPQTPTPEADQPIELVVTGEQDGYRVPNASTATKTDTPLRDIPASIQIVPRQVLQDQKAVWLQDQCKTSAA